MEKIESENTPLDVGTPRVQDFQNYRVYLGVWFAAKRKLRAGFSYRKFSSVLGLKSPNFMQLVIKGERNLSKDLLPKLLKVLGLKGAEKAYFLALVEMDQSKSEVELKKAERELLIARKKLLTTPIDRSRFEVLEKWYHLLVRELVLLPEFQPTGQWISERLSGVISPEEAEESLRLLLDAGFLVRKGSSIETRDVSVDTGDQIFTRAQMQRHHAEALSVWAKNLQDLDPSQQELGILHIPISSSRIPELKQRMRAFQDEIVGWLASETEADRVVQLGTYLIPFRSTKN